MVSMTEGGSFEPGGGFHNPVRYRQHCHTWLEGTAAALPNTAISTLFSHKTKSNGHLSFLEEEQGIKLAPCRPTVIPVPRQPHPSTTET